MPDFQTHGRAVRPFHIVGHNTNSLAEIQNGLNAGMNAFEIDINKDRAGNLYAAHDEVSNPGGANGPLEIGEFFGKFSQIVGAAGSAVSLAVLDCKVTDPKVGMKIFRAAREKLINNCPRLPVIYSVPFISHAGLFDLFYESLGDREGLMIDEEKSAAQVSNYFASKNIKNACYGNGISTVPIIGIGLPSPRLASELDAAVAIESLGNLRFIYSWVIAREETMREHIQIGVDGMIVDIPRAAALRNIINNGAALGVRAATIDDDPFAPAAPPAIEARTGDVARAGTDANITFILKDADGDVLALRTVDGSLDGRFERGSSTWIALRDGSLNIDDVVEIAVQRDGHGIAPDWFLESIQLHQRGAGKVMNFSFNQWIDATHPVSARES
ncbi:MAG: hypothetical protein HY286_20305 [Planctomycetes bacterium]|nr:hypothetical protein [Planctomycetota bacterium]